ncbi:hypothetical protein ACIRPH_20235 [Nocardiopsis sp. NPDC101807]|uniref:hypothetical protein n=1 Tax=Nocardiopsis sp. NPDC101807 TaxID=3364339 RepID=UPI00381058F9
MSTPTPPARRPVVFTALLTGVGAQWVVLEWLTEGRVSGMAPAVTVFWSALLTRAVRTYRQERRDHFARHPPRGA